jgi:hypothetical protein
MQIKNKIKGNSFTVTREDEGKTLIVMKGPGFFGCVTSKFVPVNTDSIHAFQKLVRIGIKHSNTLMAKEQKYKFIHFSPPSQI